MHHLVATGHASPSCYWTCLSHSTHTHYALLIMPLFTCTGIQGGASLFTYCHLCKHLLCQCGQCQDPSLAGVYVCVYAVAGSPVDPGLASYYGSVPESELHPAWSLYHQPKPEDSAEAEGAAAAHIDCSAAQQRSERQVHEENATSNAAQSVTSREGALVESQQSGSPMSQIQQGLARTTEQIGKTLDQGKAAAGRARASSAHFVRSAWSSSSDWNHDTTEPDWPAQPATPGQADSACNTGSQAPPAEPNSVQAEAVASVNPPLPTQEESGGSIAVGPAVSPTAVSDGLPAHAKQLLSSFRLHSVTTPSILATLSVPINHDLSVLPQQQHVAAFTTMSAQFAQSGIVIPGADSASAAGCSSQSSGQCKPDEHLSFNQRSDWDPADVSKGPWGATDPSTQGTQPAEFGDRLSSFKQLAEGGMPSDQATPTFSGRPGRGRMGAANGRDDTLVEPKYTPGVPPPPRGTLQISATAGAVWP